MSNEDLRKLETFQMRCLHDILGVTLWDRMWNTTILEKAGRTSCDKEDFGGLDMCGGCLPIDSRGVEQVERKDLQVECLFVGVT